MEALRIDLDLANYLLSEHGSPVSFCTEYVRDELKFRCHPNFQDEGPMYDWMRVAFQDEKTNQISIYPSRLAAVLVFERKTPKEHYKLVIQCCEKINTSRSSVLLKHWSFSEKYHTIDPTAVHSPCFVVKTDQDTVCEVLAKEKWPWQFTENYTGVDPDIPDLDMYGKAPTGA